MPSFPIVVLASGSGTNLQTILDQLHGRGLDEVIAVGSDKPCAGALGRAAAAGIDTAVFPADAYADRMGRDVAMGDWVESHRPALVVLAGYKQLLTEPFVGRFAGRIVNIHPALLPEFVDEGVDTGPVILQRRVPVPVGREGGAGGSGAHGRAPALS